MQILVTGANGQLGHDVVKQLTIFGYEDILTPSSDELDITNKKKLDAFFLINRPDIIIHCAAYTSVDRAEDENEKCFSVNVVGTKHLIDNAKKIKSTFVYISSDYVFDGTLNRAHKTNDKTNPKSVYGMSKLKGEEIVSTYHKHFIVRISWVFGKNGNNFIKTIFKLSKEKPLIKIVNDQIGSPTYTVDVAKFLIDLIQTQNYGIFHATNEGTCSWFELTKEAFKIANITTPIFPTATKDYPTKAQRPKNSVLDKSKNTQIGLALLPDWKDAVKRFLIEIGEI
jgi:dTDP-4-dehydrorhamnose reductase